MSSQAVSEPVLAEQATTDPVNSGSSLVETQPGFFDDGSELEHGVNLGRVPASMVGTEENSACQVVAPNAGLTLVEPTSTDPGFIINGQIDSEPTPVVQQGTNGITDTGFVEDDGEDEFDQPPPLEPEPVLVEPEPEPEQPQLELVLKEPEPAPVPIEPAAVPVAAPKPMMKKPMKGARSGGGGGGDGFVTAKVKRARQNSISVMASKGFDLPTTMTVLSTFEQAKMDPERWDEALEKISPEQLKALAEMTEAEQARKEKEAAEKEALKMDSFAEGSEEEEEEEEGGEGGDDGDEKPPEFEVDDGMVSKLKAQIFSNWDDEALPETTPVPVKSSEGRSSGPSPSSRGRQARRASVSFLSTQGIEGMQTEGILQTLSSAGVGPEQWER